MNYSRRLVISLGVLALGTLGVAVAQEIQESQPALADSTLAKHVRRTGETPPPIDPSPVEACAHGHYKTLLKMIPVPADQATYGDFCDFGKWSGSSYGGQENLPPGYWVYLAPNWYIFQASVNGTPVPLPPVARPWGPEQATGAPDTWPKNGDLRTAWASKTPDGQAEWLELTYDAPTRPAAVMIYETYNPGAVNRVTGYNADGKEFDLWSGADPTPAGSEKGISVIPVHPETDVTRIRVYVDSQKVAGWNEIDAVGLVDAAGVTHWAKCATASSTYADYYQGLPGEPGGATDLPFDNLEFGQHDR